MKCSSSNALQPPQMPRVPRARVQARVALLSHSHVSTPVLIPSPQIGRPRFFSIEPYPLRPPQLGNNLGRTFREI